MSADARTWSSPTAAKPVGRPAAAISHRPLPTGTGPPLREEENARHLASAHRASTRHYISRVSTTAPTLFDYARFVEDLKRRIDGARLSAARAVNRELVALYWDIGQAIREQQARRG